MILPYIYCIYYYIDLYDYLILHILLVKLSIIGLNHAVDEEMVEGLVRDTVVLLNFLPNSETPGATPRTILDGERLNYARWSRVYAGQVAEFEIPYADHNKRGTRRELGYVIGHQGDNPIVRLLPHGKRLVIRSGHIKPVSKSAAIVSLIEDGITGAKRQRYNDLIAEINDFYGVPYDLPANEEPQPVETTSSPPPPSLDAPPEFNFLAQPSPEPLPVSPTDSTLQPPLPIEDSPLPPAPDLAEERAQVVSESSPPLPENRLSEPQYPAPSSNSPTRVSRSPRAPTQRHALHSPRALRPGARKPPGFYRKLASGESVSDYTACHLRATECERLYGATMTRAAAVTEVSNMIAARKAALPVDYRKLSKRTIREALPSFMFYKAKDETPEPLPNLLNHNDSPVTEGWTTVLSKKFKKKPKRKIRLRGRWVGGGHRQQRCKSLQERIAPTARSTTHSLLLAIASKEGRRLQVGDIPSAYLQAEHKPANGQPVHIIADKYTTSIIIDTFPEYRDYALPNGTMVLRVEKAMYGLIESAWLWYKELEKHLLSIGYKVDW